MTKNGFTTDKNQLSGIGFSFSQIDHKAPRKAKAVQKW